MITTRLSLVEAAARYGLHKRTLWELVRVGRLPAVRMPHPRRNSVLLMVDEDDLEALAVARGWTRATA